MLAEVFALFKEKGSVFENWIEIAGEAYFRERIEIYVYYCWIVYFLVDRTVHSDLLEFVP